MTNQERILALLDKLYWYRDTDEDIQKDYLKILKKIKDLVLEL